jgi:simple sugar transport system ATP-binding protein
MPYLEFKDLRKRFGSIEAVSGVSLRIQGNEILGILGDNGAGKSTIVGMLAGVYAPDAGEILVNGERMGKWNVNAARSVGIETVFQDRALAEQQSITTNIFMGREIRLPLGFINAKRQKLEAARLIDEMGLTSKLINPDTPILTMSGGERQGISIARALYFKAQLVILDEPTTALSIGESEKVFQFIRKLKQEGCSCIFISHNIYHCYDICDRFIVIDHGKVAYECSKEQTTAELLIKDMRSIARGEERHDAR